MNQIYFQLKQAWAGLNSRKGFLVTVVTTLGITLGALLCILTLAHLLISKPLPYPEQDNLYQVNHAVFSGEDRLGHAFTYPSLVHLYQNQTLFSESAMVHFNDGGALSVLSAKPSKPVVNTTFITPGYFKLFDASFSMGRPFEETEELDTYNPVVILSYETWQQHYNSDSEILDKTISVDGSSFRVVGVLSNKFVEPQLDGVGVKTDVFLPWDYNNSTELGRRSFAHFGSPRRFVGKLDGSLSVSQTEQTLSTMINSVWQENVASIARFSGRSVKMELQPIKELILGESQNAVILLLIGVAGLVLVACANITNLFMSRTVEQQRQLAIQAAVGASKRHLFHSLLAQSGLVVFLSILVALGVASGGFWVLQEYLALRLPRVDELTINSITLGSAVLIAIFLGLLFARISANMINYNNLNSTLQSSGKGTGIQVSQGVRKLLVVSQVAIVTLLVFVNTGLFKDSLKVINQPLGFDTDNVISMTIPFSSTESLSDEEISALFLEVRAQISALPQVETFSQGAATFGYARRAFQTIVATDEGMGVATRPVDGRHFEMINQPLIEGDYFTDADFHEQNNLMIINDVYAAKVNPEGSAIGAQIQLGDVQYTISGVVKGLLMPAATEIPMRAYPMVSKTDHHFSIKLKPNQTLSRETVVSALNSVSGQLDLLLFEPLDEQRDRMLFAQYTTAITSAVLAILTFLLATIGLYGILSYSTQMRRFELGTRIAIGAKRFDIISLVIKDNIGAVGIGIVLSIIVMLGLYVGFTEALASYVTSEIASLFAVTLGLVTVMTLFSCYWPLRPIINAPAIRSLRGSQ